MILSISNIIFIFTLLFKVFKKWFKNILYYKLMIVLINVFIGYKLQKCFLSLTKLII